MLRMLRQFWERWKVVARKIGDVQSRILLNVFYFLILAPFAIATRMFSDRLQLRSRSSPRWLPKESRSAALREDARRQF